MHATWFHGHIKHQPASGCRGCVWFITLNYSSHPKLEALGLKTKSEEPKNSCNYVFFWVFFFERPLEGVDRSTLIIPSIYYSSRFSQRHQWIFAIRIFMDPWQVQEACKCLWDSQMRLLAGRRQQIFLRIKHGFIGAFSHEQQQKHIYHVWL